MSITDLSAADLSAAIHASDVSCREVMGDHQGRGLGAATLAPGLRSADEHGLMACLETSAESNVRFYSRLGFGVMRQSKIADGAGPDLWLMRREPRPV